MTRAVFLDRDGVINRKPPEGQYVTRWEELHFLPGVAPAISQLNRSGFRVIVVTNQRCVAKGLITSSELEVLHQRMCDALAGAGATIDGAYYCPHEKELACGCRKPAAGMLFDAARTHEIDLKASWMIGDSKIDIEAGRKAGCKTAQLLSTDEAADGNADVVAPSLSDVIYQILKREENRVIGLIPEQHEDREVSLPNAACTSLGAMWDRLT
jgi:D-glycero-D-manno-heptose 1,7-bisphosphate phosphatase